MSTVNDAVIRLAEAIGVELEYTDNWGNVHRTDTETARRILEAKGIKIRSDLIKSRSGAAVVSAGNLPDRFYVHFDRGAAYPEDASTHPHVRLTFEHDSGDRRVFDYGPEELTTHHSDRPCMTALSVPFPRDLASGCYTVTADADWDSGDHHSQGTWIVCPVRAYAPDEIERGRKIGGIFVSLYGLRSKRNWGVGDFTDLKALVDFAYDVLNVDFIGLNPLHALFNRQPYGICPYLPSSRLYRNYLYVDVTIIPEFMESPKARELAGSPDTQSRIRELRDEIHVNYEAVAELKLRTLRLVFESFRNTHKDSEASSERLRAFMSYVDAEGRYLHNFAVFCALEEKFRKASTPIFTWREWPAEFQHPDSPEVVKYAEENKEEVLFWKYLQWQIDEQLSGVQEHARAKGMLLGLYHDAALAIDKHGADFWSLRDYYHEGFSVGAPPDGFAPHGQDWGVAPPNSERMKEDAYKPFIRMLDANCAHGGALRIDHVLQFNRLFWIPEGRPPKEGVYVRDYESDLTNLVTLLSQRNRTVIIGEDLGTVPWEFRDRLMERGLFSYRLFYFERDAEGKMQIHTRYPEQALVAVTTHDLPTLAGFWQGLDIDLRHSIGQLDDEMSEQAKKERAEHKGAIIEMLVQQGFLPAANAHDAWMSPTPTEHLHSAVLAFIFAAASKLAVVGLEDIFLDSRQQNVPGTTVEHPNWVTKTKYTIEEMRTKPEAVTLTERFRNAIRSSDRAAGQRA